ncbi:hypothetical protein GPECTOR_1g166 [Gonium pectorale]|uniref:CCZ1/INTU/HSP4 first Longin domain-containing protein n=1 Tax=Gonium pectorale TaxID=33097 RepID=A0A150H2I3_GONPE|nr:hypothetical protein GPECTOR_1g166 [Gonium pectorale]|eukprot:KXZ56192.1 hypothetical protein GPECTOR_1g166 [Gonium pectorale]
MAHAAAQDGSRFKSMVAEQFKWVLFEAEPDIWMMAVMRRSWATPMCTDAAPRALLTSLYDVFVLLNGPMESLLQQDPTGFSVRRVMQPLLDEAGARLLRPEGAATRGPGGSATLLSNPLAPHDPGALPLLTPSHSAFLAVQCLVQQLLVASFFGSRLVAGVAVFWGGLPVASTLGPRDTAAVTTLAARALEPAARAAQKARPAGAGTPMALAAGAVGLGSLAAAAGGGGGAGETAHDTLLCPLQWRAGGGIHPTPLPAASPGGAAATPTASSTAAAAAAAVLSTFSSAGVASMLGSAAGTRGATPQLPGSSEWCQLLPYHRGPLLVAVLLHDGPPPGTDTLAALAAVLGRGAGPAAAALAAEVPQPRLQWHERGHRYCYTDALCSASRFTPLKKVLTLSPSALRHMALLRNKLDEWDAAAARQRRAAVAAAQEQQQQEAAGSGSEAAAGASSNGAAAAPASSSAASIAGPTSAAAAAPCGDAELVVRTGRDAWLVLRSAPGGRRLYAAGEGGPEAGLGGAVAPTDALCDRLFPGVFLQP